MSNALDFFLVIFIVIFAAVLSIATGVGGCEWRIYDRAARMDVAFWYFSNNPPNSASVADSVTFLVILYYTCTSPFSRGIAVIGALDFGPRKKIPLI